MGDERSGNNLEALFPDDLNMPLVNSLLARCVVREEKDCSIASASDMILAVDEIIAKIKARTGYRPDTPSVWPCRVCGKGSYRDVPGSNYIVRAYRNGGPVAQQEAYFHIHICDHCKHGELFRAG